MNKKYLENIIHLHVHSEDSSLDGLNTVEELVERAVEIGSTALALTDHGVMSGIPDFIVACEEQGIKPIPGVEAYMTKDRLIRGPELEAKRDEIYEKYKIVDNKGKPRRRDFNRFVSTVRRNISEFEELAPPLIKNYIMDEPMDLFDINFGSEEEEQTPEEKIQEFKKDILNYLSYSENYHLLLLAMNNQGLQDLYKITSDAHINGFHSDPRTDLTYIRENNLGKHIIATSACLGSYFAQLCLRGQIEEAKEFVQECKDTFHSFYLEKQATLIREQLILNKIIDKIAEETNTPKIVTTDAHFARKEDHKVHDVLVAGSFNKCVGDTDRYVYAEDHYLKTVEDIMVTFRDDEAIANTHKIAEQVNVTLPKEALLPLFPVEEGDKASEILKKKSWSNLFQYCLDNPDIDYNEYANRLNYELDIIISRNFEDYFLITEDFVVATKEQGYLIGPGRGSGAGSLVCFVLNITTLDPIKYSLLFERFLNPERAGYPDLDIDFDDEGRKWVFGYLQEKYNEENVAQIGTKLTLAARSAIRFVSKALGHSGKGNLELENAFATAVPGTPGIKLQEAYAQEEMVRTYAKNYPEWWEVATKLEGHVRSFGVHAAGVVISPRPITEIVPLRVADGSPTTQYDMDWIEKLLVKFDILKLDTLDFIRQTLINAGVEDVTSIEEIDLNDQKVYREIFHQLHLNGVFQVESDGMRDVIDKIKPTSFEELGAIVALYRPGPMDFIPSYIERKHGREEVKYPFPELESVLDETYGIFIYQEQIMEASRILGGLSLGHADMIRKAVADMKPDLMNRWLDLMIYGSEAYKKTHEALIQQYPKRKDIPLNDRGEESIWVDYKYKDVPDVEGAIPRGFDLDSLMKLKENWISFGSYAFNKSHSFSYAKITFQTAWLKCYYPTEFLAALLTVSEGKRDSNGRARTIGYMSEAETLGVQILPPDINESVANWTPLIQQDPNNPDKTIRSIRYGIGSIAGISHETFEEIEKYKPYSSLEDLVSNVDRRKVNRTKVINLIKAGAFDFIDKNRNNLLRAFHERQGEDISHIPKNMSKTLTIKYEREALGTSVTIKSRWETIAPGTENVQFTGIIKKIEPFTSRKGQEHARMMFETQEDEINSLIFNYLWKGLKTQIVVGQKITVRGERSDDALLIKNLRIVD